MKKLIGLILAIALVCSLCVGAQADDKVYEIKLVTSLSSTDPSVQLMQQYSDKIRELTGGNVDIQLYPDGQILMNEEGIEAMQSDAAVICFNDPCTIADYVPEYDTICAPFLFSNNAEIEAFCDSEKYAELLNKANDAGFHLITSKFNFGGRSVLADGIELRSIDACKELNIRIPNVTIYVNLFNALGANYQATSWSNGLTGIETGMLNGCECTAQRASTAAVYQLLKTPVYSMLQYMVNPCALQVGYGYWTKLPEEYRDIISEQFDLCAQESNRMVNENEAHYIADLEANGVKVIRADEIDFSGFYAAADSVNASLADYDAIKAAVVDIQQSLA